MNELSRISRLDRTTLVRKLKPLQSEGLACMYTSGAKTANLIALTDKGKKVLETTDPLWNRAQESFRERFDGDEWEYFTRILLKLGQINDPIK
jgi:DNA-binding MarR family transcriptional regulator